MAQMHPARQLIGRFLAIGLIAAHLFVIALTMSPALHHWLHGDAGESDHHCAVTAMIDGQFDRPETQCFDVAQPPVVFVIRDAADPAQPLPEFLHASPGERAPPLA